MALTDRQIQDVMATDRAHLLYPDALRHNRWVDGRAPYVDIVRNKEDGKIHLCVICNGYVQYPDTGPFRLKKLYTIKMDTPITPSVIHDVPQDHIDFITYRFSVESLYNRLEHLNLSKFKRLAELIKDDIDKAELAVRGQLNKTAFYSADTFGIGWEK